MEKYRIAWNFSGTKMTNGKFSSPSSPSFTLKFWKCTINLNFQTLSNCKTSCQVYLEFPLNPAGLPPTVLNCTYYMLNEATGKHHKLENCSPFLTDWFDLEIKNDRMEFLVVIVVDLDDAPIKSECWLEGRTEALDNIRMCHSSGNYYASLNGRQCCLKFIAGINGTRTILMEELKADELIRANFTMRNKRSDESDRCIKLIVRPYQTRFVFHKSEEITGVDLDLIFTPFAMMTNARISKIAAIIKQIDSLSEGDSKQSLDMYESNTTTKHKENKIKKKIQLPESSHAPDPIICPNNQTITEICPRRSTILAADEVAVTDDQLKLMYKCFVDNRFCDITIQVPNGPEIKAHKNVLFSGSTVWRELLAENDDLPFITVADLERETIQTLVTYIYIGSVPKPQKQTDQLLIAAETYGVDGLKTWCEQQLIETITMDSAVNLLVLAHRYNAKTLFDHVLAFVRKYTTELKIRDEWKSAFFSYPELAFEIFNILL